MEAGYYFDAGILRGISVLLARKALEYAARDLQQGIRRVMKRQTKKFPHSKPGEPPRLSGVDSPLKKLVAWNVDEKALSLKVGPMIFKDSKGNNTSTVPHILEKGGTAIAHVTEFRNIVHKKKLRPKWFTNDDAKKRAKGSSGWKIWYNDNTYTVNKPVQIKPRPYVAPQFKRYLEGDGIRKALMRAHGQTPKKGFDSKWSWKKV